ncbi:11623_t:CDS:2, partial [Acaulospora colombiana]
SANQLGRRPPALVDGGKQITTMKLTTVCTTMIFYFALSQATPVDKGAEVEKRACCDRLNFTICYMGCGFGCNVPGCPTCKS